MTGNSTATIYAAEGGPAVQSVLTDAAGRFSFYAADGRYDLTVTGLGIVAYKLADVTLNDPGDVAALSFSDGAGKIGYGQRTVKDKLDETISVKDFGAKVDGVTDDTAAVTAANAQPVNSVPGSVAITTLAASALNANYTGPGQIKTGVNKRGRYFSAIKAAPATLGDESSVDTAFNGDWSRQNFSIEHRISGAATLGQPANGYLYRPEAMANYTYLYNASGWNDSTSSNTGRTGVAAYRARVYQAGQGDAVAFNASAFVVGTKAGSTSFLANPAGVLFNGDIGAGTDGVYLNAGEMILHDNGKDVAGIGWVVNLDRTNATGAKKAWWAGMRVQSMGAASVDVAYSGNGKFKWGFDASQMDLSTQGALVMKAGQCIYGNATVGDPDQRFPSANPNDLISYNSGLGGWLIMAGGVSALQVTSTSVNINAFANFITNSGARVSNSATAGAASALPSAPYKYLTIQLDGASYKLPVYNT